MSARMEARLEHGDAYCAPGDHFIEPGEKSVQMAGTHRACLQHAGSCAPRCALDGCNEPVGYIGDGKHCAEHQPKRWPR